MDPVSAAESVFPVWLRVGPLAVHPHFVLEALAYVAGAVVYVVLRRR